MPIQLNHNNNFDGIRLLAAIQVFIGHGFLFHFFQENAVSNVIWFIPGVPVFFGMSGFLLLWSLERHAAFLPYLKNRFLRLYPALWVTMILTTVILLTFRTLLPEGLLNPSFLLYFFGRCSIIFSFVPALIKPFAKGNPNGSLWTIGVELQFYFILPLIYRLIRGRSLFWKNILLLSIGAASWWIDRTDPQPPFEVSHLNGYLQILVSEFRILYYLFFFIIGMLFYVNYPYLKKILEGRALIHLLLYGAICTNFFRCSDVSKLDQYAPDGLSLLRYIFLMALVFSAAFSRTGLSAKLLKGNDYSYGIYLTHLLVLNSFYQWNRFNGPWNFFLSIPVTAILAFFSWHVIEKRALRWKTHPWRASLRRTGSRLFLPVL